METSSSLHTLPKERHTSPSSLTIISWQLGIPQICHYTQSIPVNLSFFPSSNLHTGRAEKKTKQKNRDFSSQEERPAKMANLTKSKKKKCLFVRLVTCFCLSQNKSILLFRPRQVVQKNGIKQSSIIVKEIDQFRCFFP